MTRASDVAKILKQPFTNTLGTSNYRAGVNAGDSIASGGNYNVAIGDEAGTAITTGDHNTAIGFSALDAEDTGTASTAVGSYALTAQNRDGNNYNTAVGYVAGSAVTTGVNNTFIGALCGDAQTVADNNTAIGYEALTTNTNGSGSVAVGYRALKTQNYSSATDSLNVAVGNAAMQSSTTGVRNVALGTFNLYANTTGGRNTAVGYGVMQTCTEGEYNTAIGHNALNSLTTATYNTAIGPRNSGDLITTGSKNTIIGDYNGNQDSLDIRTASNYVVLSDGDGNIAGYRIGTSGGRQWHLIADADSDVGFAIKNKTSVNPYGIAIQFTNAANNNGSQYFIVCTDSAASRFLVYNNGNVVNTNNSYGQYSDQKLKENITDATSQWNDIKSLKVRKFNFKGDDLTQIGVVAQELESAGMNGLVEENTDRDEEMKDLGTTTKSVKYSVLYMKAVKCLQEAMTRIEALEAEVKALKGE